MSALEDDFAKEKESAVAHHNKLIQDIMEDQQTQTNTAKADMLYAQDKIEILQKQLKSTKIKTECDKAVIISVHAKASKLHKQLELAAEEKACVIANHAKKIWGWGLEELNATRDENEKLRGKLLEKTKQNVSGSTEGEFLNSGFGEFEKKANAVLDLESTVHSRSTTINDRKVVPRKANANMTLSNLEGEFKCTSNKLKSTANHLKQADECETMLQNLISELQQKAKSMSVAKSSATREMQSLLSSRSEYFMLIKKAEAKAPRVRHHLPQPLATTILKQHDAKIKRVVFDEIEEARVLNETRDDVSARE